MAVSSPDDADSILVKSMCIYNNLHIKCRMLFCQWILTSVVVAGLCRAAPPARPGEESEAVLPGTKPLLITVDFASEMVAGIDRFLLAQIEESKRSAQSSGSAISLRTPVIVLPSRPIASALPTFWGSVIPGRHLTRSATGPVPSSPVASERTASRFSESRGRPSATSPGKVWSCAPWSGNGRGRRYPGRRPDARAACGPVAGRSPGVAGGPATCGVRISGGRPHADRSHDRGEEWQGKAHKSRVRVPSGIRAGPALDRL